MQLDLKKELAKSLAGAASASRAEIVDDLSTYMTRVFAPVPEMTRLAPFQAFGQDFFAVVAPLK
jgi:hypothetical protein